jgi:Protein of unknown function (DUF2568)
MCAANGGLRFLLELAMLVSLAYWGWVEGDGILSWVLALAAPLSAAVLWGVLLAPRARRRLADPWRLVAEIAFFGSAALALWRSGSALLAVVFAALVGLHHVLTFVLDQLRPRTFA